MQVYGVLEKAQLENVSSDLSNTLLGLVWYNTTDNKARFYDGAVRSVVSEDGTQTLTNKTFSGGTITGAAISGGTVSGIDINLGVASDTNKIVLSQDTKTNLDALTREAGSMYYATDEAKYYGDDGLNLVDLGSGGAGGINYVTNPDAETNADDHTAYKDSASSIPDDGVGGSPTLSVARSVTDPLVENASFIITKPASNVQGEGVSIACENFDLADRGKAHIISFEYDASDTNALDGDFRVFFKDETNGIVYRVVGEDILGGSGTHYARIQVPLDCVSGSVLIHCAATHADGYDLKYDRVSIGPQKISMGSVIDDFKDFTPTGTWTTNTTYFGQRRRVGDVLNAKIRLQMAGAPNAVNLTLDMPDVLLIDSSKLELNAGFAEVGRGVLYTVSQSYVLKVLVDPSNLDELRIFYTNELSSNVRTVPLDHNSPVTIASGYEVLLDLSVPVQGWSSRSKISSDFGGREIFVEGRSNGGGAITAATTDIDFTEIDDTVAGFDGQVFVATKTAKYNFKGSTNWTTAAIRNLFAYLDTGSGFVQDKLLGTTPGLSSSTQPFNGTLSLNKGDRVVIRSNTNGGTLAASADTHWLTITEVTTSQQILGGDDVSGRVTSDNGQTIPTGTETVVVFEDVEYDTAALYDNTTGILKIREKGKFVINGQARVQGLNSGDRVFGGLQVNGTTIQNDFQEAAASWAYVQGSEVLDLEKDDEVTFFVSHDKGSNASIAAFGFTNSFSWIKVN